MEQQEYRKALNLAQSLAGADPVRRAECEGYADTCLKVWQARRRARPDSKTIRELELVRGHILRRLRPPRHQAGLQWGMLDLIHNSEALGPWLDVPMTELLVSSQLVGERLGDVPLATALSQSFRKAQEATGSTWATVRDGLAAVRADVVAFLHFADPSGYLLFQFQQDLLRQMDATKWHMTVGPRGGSKTLLAGRFLVWMAIRHGVDGGRSVVVAPQSYKQAKLTWYVAREFVEASPWLSQDLRSAPQEGQNSSSIRFKNGGSIEARSPKRTRGLRGDILAVTESRDLAEESYKWDEKPILSGGTKKKILLETSAGVVGSYGHTLMEEWSAKEAAGSRQHRVAVFDLDTLKTCGYPLDLDVVEDDRETDPLGFANNYMALWIATSSDAPYPAITMSPTLRRGDLTWNARPGHRYFVGIDTAPPEATRSHSACIVVEVDEKQRVALAFAQVWADSPSTNRLAAELAGIIRRFAPESGVMDERGGGQNVVEALREQHGIAWVKHGGILHKAPGSDKDNTLMHRAVRKMIDSDVLDFPKPPEDDSLQAAYEASLVIARQLCDLRAEKNASGWNSYSVAHGKRKDAAMGFCYAMAAVQATIHPEPSEESLLDKKRRSSREAMATKGAAVVPASSLRGALKPGADPRATETEDEQSGVEEQILGLLREHPDLLDKHSWPEMRSLAERTL